MKHLILALMLIVLTPVGTPAWAVQPDEVLTDPALEQRARQISKGLRCLVCRNENIDDSNADLARDLRLLVRERLVAGDTDDDVVEYVVERYGEYVLLTPRGGGTNLLLWGAGPAMLLLGLFVGVLFLRGRARGSDDTLTAEEEAQLKEILDR
ncbi:MAG: cytochrome C biogenesis protein CcdA [Pseudooceanicola sp.]|nr:cytochrome C biogenesis protein CcdA [Pseudooceanicola sp.]|tara:strand:+ start:10 stop:468 length:459 start_codon:yes stop_codon:yes gene_type:complete